MKSVTEKTVITYGTFDMFHIGHLELLRRVRALGDRLVVAVSTDEFNELKNKKTLIPYQQRAQIVEAIKYVDEVIPEHSWEQKVNDVRQHGVDIFAMGEDWRGKFDFLNDHCEVHYLPRTEGISTTVLKDHLDKISRINIQDLNHALEILRLIKQDFE